MSLPEHGIAKSAPCFLPNLPFEGGRRILSRFPTSPGRPPCSVGALLSGSDQKCAAPEVPDAGGDRKAGSSSRPGPSEGLFAHPSLSLNDRHPPERFPEEASEGLSLPGNGDGQVLRVRAIPSPPGERRRYRGETSMSGGHRESRPIPRTPSKNYSRLSAGPPSPMPEASPMMVQYRSVKDRYPDHLVLFRVGDFFETFEEDAGILSRELDVALTSRQVDGQGRRIPLAGIPYHSLEGHLARLVRKGWRVVICDQVEDPRTARGLVRREVTRVVTPGTVVEEGLLHGDRSNFLGAWREGSASEGSRAALVDVSTGQTRILEGLPADPVAAAGEIARLEPAEMLVPSEAVAAWKQALPTGRIEMAPEPIPGPDIPQAWKEAASSHPSWEPLLGTLAAYVRQTEPRLLDLLGPPRLFDGSGTLRLDPKTLRHLEVLAPRGASEQPPLTLLDSIRQTVTPAGGRTLEEWLRMPLARREPIQARQEVVRYFLDRPALREDLQELLSRLGDPSRVVSRIAARRASPRDVRRLGDSLRIISEVRDRLRSESDLPPRLRELGEEIHSESELAQRLERSLVREPPIVIGQGGALNPEAFPDLREVRDRESRAKDHLRELEREEAVRTGIRGLKVGYHQVFGYFFEVPHSQLDRVPSHWRRKQTLAQVERYGSDELTRWETEIRDSSAQGLDLERRLWEELLASVDARAPWIQASGRALGEIDALASFARTARERHWILPRLRTEPGCVIREGRHAILEQLLGPAYVPNDTELDPDRSRLLLLTGPNMAGKSTYMRQVGLIVLLAHCGSAVPARYAEIGLVSSLSTRMGFTDDIGRGKSSFMLEMSEVAEILARSDSRSLVLLDEVGRGTGTRDGLAVAWAVLKYLHDHTRSLTIVATHYHELATWVESLSAARSAHMAVFEREGKLEFLRTLLPGGSDRSYGVWVAELAGVPSPVVREARRTLGELEQSEVPPHPGTGPGSPSRRSRPARYTQALLVEDPLGAQARQLLSEISNLKLETLTPLEALRLLEEIQKKARGLGRDPATAEASPAWPPRAQE